MAPDIATLEGPLEAISEGILLLDRSGSVVWFNKRLAELFGFPPEEGQSREQVLGAMSERMVDPEAYVRRVREIIATDEPHARDVLVLKNGRSIERISRPHVVGETRIGRILVYRDVTREQHVAAALESSEARFHHVIAAAPDGILLIDKWRIVYANDAFARAIGRTADDLVDTSVLDLLSPEERADVHQAGLRIMERQQARSVRERQFVRADGAIVFFEVAALRIELGGQPTMVLFMRDITERRRMQAQLAVSDRMASIGAMASGIAHEINNPLAYVIANIDLMRSHVTAEGQRMLDLAAEGCLRIKSVVADLATLSRTGEKEETERLLDVRWTLDASLSLARALISTRARIVTEYEEAPLVRANDARLSQVFLNLLLNAAQAIEPGNPQGNEIRVRCAAKGKRVVVTIADTGRGISRENLPRIFDPFFTTKAPAEGTGLGLSICQSIVCGLGGQITAESRGERGTIFRVELPSTETEESFQSLDASPQK